MISVKTICPCCGKEIIVEVDVNIEVKNEVDFIDDFNIEFGELKGGENKNV